MIRSVPLAARRVRQTVTGFHNGPQLLAQMARQSMTGRPETLTFRPSTGGAITVPNRPGARVPVFEIFVEDEYRLDWFLRGLSERPVVLDVGAHVGCFSVAVAHRLPDALIVAYEASPSTARFLHRNIVENGIDDRARVNNLAVQGESGELEIADNGAGSGHNGVLHLPTSVGRVRVRSVSMAEALHVTGRSAELVKIDTEGGEYDMVLGSQPGDWAGVRRVVLEYHDLPGHDWAELERFFDAAGLHVVRREAFGPRLGMAWLARDLLAP